MKTILKIFALLLIILIIDGCSEDKKTTNEMEILDKSIQNPTTKRGMEDRYNLFTHNTFNLDEKLSKALNDISNAVRFELQGDQSIGRIATDITIDSKKGVLPTFRYYNRSGRLIKDYIWNPQTAYYDDILTGNSGEPVAEGVCREGGESLGFCYYGVDYGDCVSRNTAIWVISELSNGEKPTITITQNLTGSWICGSSKR